MGPRSNSQFATVGSATRSHSMKALVSVLLLAVGPLYAQDPLPSRNDTAPKKAIVDFVEKVT